MVNKISIILQSYHLHPFGPLSSILYIVMTLWIHAVCHIKNYVLCYYNIKPNHKNASLWTIEYIFVIGFYIKINCIILITHLKWTSKYHDSLCITTSSFCTLSALYHWNWIWKFYEKFIKMTNFAEIWI